VQQQLVGPGHATYVKVDDGWRIIYHASIGENCDRYAFINELVFGADGWPYVNFPSDDSDGDNSSHGLSQDAVIAIAVVVPVVGICAIVTMLYYAFAYKASSGLLGADVASSSAPPV
jgi:hypothetical protein